MARQWYKRRGGDFLMATLGFPSVEHRWAYSAVLDMLNERDRPLADDPGFICGFTGLSKRRWSAVRQWLLDGGFLIIDRRGNLTNPAFEREREEREELRGIAVETGREGGLKSAQQRAAREPELPLAENDANQRDIKDLPQGSPRPHPRAPSAPARTGARTDAAGNSNLSLEKLEINAGLSGDKLRERQAGSPVSNDLAERDPQPSRAREEQNRLESTQLDSSHNNIVEHDALSGGELSRDNLLGNADLLTLYEAVCDAAGYHPMSPARIAKAQDMVKGWRDTGYDFDLIVIPAIRHMVAETSEPTRTLHRFRDRIHHEAARLKAKPRGRYEPPPSPVLEPDDEDPEFRDIRRALLERLGPDTYSITANKIRFERVTDVHESRSPVLKVNPIDQMNGRPAIVEGRYASVLRNLAVASGFKEVW